MLSLSRFCFAFVGAFVVSGTANATLVDCKSPQSARFVVYLSEPQFTPDAFKDRNQMLRFFDRLQLYLDQRQDIEMAGIKQVDFRVARCEKRIPTIDGNEFTEPVVSSLYNNKVIVEIWGKLDVEKRGNKASPIAQINYLIVPIQRGRVAGSQKLSGIQRFNYPDAEIVSTDFIDLVSNMDLHAFVATAIGVFAFDDQDYPLAHEMLCKAGAQLARTEKRLARKPETQTQSDGIQQLRAFLKEVAGKTIVEARKKTPSNIPLFARLQDQSNPCPSQEVRK